MKIRAGSGRRAVLGRTGSTMSTPRASTADTPAAVGPGRGWASVSESVTRGSCENAQACPAPLGDLNGVVLPVPPRGRRLPGRNPVRRTRDSGHKTRQSCVASPQTSISRSGCATNVTRTDQSPLRHNHFA
jgi:hypothetical protein